MDIQKVLSFTDFLAKFRDIERTIYFGPHRRRENDAEHGWQMAMLAWYMISTEKLELSLEKVLCYCIVHDMPEMYAGDVEALRRTPEIQKMKEEKEKESIERIHHEFPEAHEIRKRIEEYDKQEDRESKFVYALDKLIPALNVYNGKVWRKEKEVTLDELAATKNGKVQRSEEIASLWNQLHEMLKEEESTLFHMPGEKK